MPLPTEIDYSLIQRTPDGTGQILITTPPNVGSYATEQALKNWILADAILPSDVVNNLTTHETDVPLSAEQGTVLKQLIDAVSGGITPKGDILSTNLPAASASNKGWQYYCTDINKWATSDGTQWVMTSNSIIVQTPDATDTGHALSNAVVTEHFNDLDDGFRNTANRVTSNSQRIANIEDKSEPFTIEYPSSDYGKGTVPASIEKSGMSVKVKGRTRAWNNLVKNYASPSDTKGLSITYDSTTGTVTVSGQPTSTGNVSLFSADNWIGGHKYLLLGFPSKNGIYLNRYIGVQLSDQGSGAIATASGSGSSDNIRLVISATTENYNFSFKVIHRDLTLLFGAGNEPTSVSDALKALPDLGKYTPYGYSLPSTIVSGMKSVGVNIWDEEWESGIYDLTTGEKEPYDACIRCKNLIPVKPSTEYYWNNSVSNVIRWVFFDKNLNVVENLGTEAYQLAFTTKSNVSYMAFYYTATTYNNTLQICLNSYPQKTVYHPYSSDSITFSEPVTLRSAGSVEDELIPESGVITRKVKEIVCNSDTNWQTSGGIFYISLDDGVVLPINKDPNIIVQDYEVVGTRNVASFSDKTCSVIAGTSAIGIRDDSYSSASDFKTAMVGKKIVYELATPTTETLSPSPTALAVEPYGEVSLIQDQDIELDGGFSMRYIPDSPYVKKADIVDNLNSSDVSKPLSANMGRVIGATLDQHDSRLQNLEQKAGDYSIVQYRGTNAVPTGKAKYGLVKTIVGKSRAWNQLLNGDTTEHSAVMSSAYANITAFDFEQPKIAGHKYLISAEVKASASKSLEIGFSDNTYETQVYGFTATSSYQTVSAILPATASYGAYAFVRNNYEADSSITAYAKKLKVFDLTLIFGSGNEPSTVADAIAQLPALGQYNAYDAGSLVDTVVSGAKSVGVNIWDEEWEVGYYDVLTGIKVWNPSFGRSKNYIPCLPETSYFFKTPASINNSMYCLFFDADKNFISYSLVFNSAVSSPSNCFFMTIFQSGWTSYDNDVQICLNSYADKTTYHPYKSDTLSLPSPVTLRSAGSVADTDELCVEVEQVIDGETVKVLKRIQTKSVEEIILNGSENISNWATPSGDYVGFTIYVSNVFLGRSLCVAGHTFVSVDSGVTFNNIYAVSGALYVTIEKSMLSEVSVNGFKAWLGTHNLPLTYVLEDPVVTLLDPIIDNTIYTEGGGTIETIQDQTPVIDNCLDVGYLAV